MIELGARVRSTLSVSLIVLGSLAAVVGGAALYLQEEVINSGAFADRAVEAIQKPAVADVAAREIVVQVVERSAPDLLLARPILQSAISSLLSSRQLAGVIRTAADHGHRLLFNSGTANAAFDVADAGTLVASALRRLAPAVARRLPPNTDAVLLALRRRSFAAQTLRFGDKVRLLGLVLPALAIVLLALAVAAAPDRRRAVGRSAVGLAVAGLLATLLLELSRLYVTSHVYGGAELTTASLRAAVGALWDSYFGDFMTLTFAVAAVSLLVAAAAWSVLAPYSASARLQRVLSVARRPLAPRPRAARGALILVAGVFILARPTLALRIVAILAGALVVYFGAGELLSGLGPAPARVKRGRSRRRVAALGGATAVAAVGVTLAIGLSWGAPKVRAVTNLTCNGYQQLCSRRLDQVVFAGTHNSMSAADSAGWYIANQNRAVGQQLQDGIRLFKISTHYGVGDAAGHVRTDIKAEGNRLNRVSDKLSIQAREALQRLGGALGLGSLRGTRDVWLCHTLCELGATRMVDFLSTIRSFLDLNPGQVIILFDEDYVDEADLQKAFQRSGLFSHLATLVPGSPLPTLGELIRSGHNVLVFAQKAPSGRYPWNMDAFRWIQDTPLGAVKPAQFSCRLSRGNASNPLLMMNDWADAFPPRLSPNIPLVARQFIMSRAQQCQVQRRHLPNLILTDFYDRGDVFGAARELNGLGNQPPAPTVAVSQTS